MYALPKCEYVHHNNTKELNRKQDSIDISLVLTDLLYLLKDSVKAGSKLGHYLEGLGGVDVRKGFLGETATLRVYVKKPVLYSTLLSNPYYIKQDSKRHKSKDN